GQVLEHGDDVRADLFARGGVFFRERVHDLRDAAGAVAELEDFHGDLVGGHDALGHEQHPGFAGFVVAELCPARESRYAVLAHRHAAAGGWGGAGHREPGTKAPGGTCPST